MELHAGKRAPVELEGRPGGVHLCRSAVDAAEDVELVVMQIDRNGVVGLVGRALRTEPRHGEKEEGKRGHPQLSAAAPERVFSPGKSKHWRRGSHLGPTYIEFR